MLIIAKAIPLVIPENGDEGSPAQDGGHGAEEELPVGWNRGFHEIPAVQDEMERPRVLGHGLGHHLNSVRRGPLPLGVGNNPESHGLPGFWGGPKSANGANFSIGKDQLIHVPTVRLQVLNF
jgi:hypothetical protein